MIFAYLLSFVSGFLVKWVDWIDDDKGGRDKIKYLIAIFYGILIGYLTSLTSFSELFLGTLLAQLFSRKVDTLSHMLGFFMVVVSLFYFGLPPQSLSFLFFFFVLAVLDEQTAGWRFRNFENYRLLLPIGAFITALLFQKWEYFLAILFFDIGYILFTKIQKNMVEIWSK
ncbi:MAG: hypothetical protein QXF35_00445 [Candidatus Bilamarchaeaceae archaeon]